MSGTDFSVESRVPLSGSEPVLGNSRALSKPLRNKLWWPTRRIVHCFGTFMEPRTPPNCLYIRLSRISTRNRPAIQEALTGSSCYPCVGRRLSSAITRTRQQGF